MTCVSRHSKAAIRKRDSRKAAQKTRPFYIESEERVIWKPKEKADTICSQMGETDTRYTKLLIFIGKY